MSQDILQVLKNYKTKNSIVYNSEFFRNHMKYRPIYDFIGDIIVGNFKPESVIDWGCGCGFLIERLYRHGIDKLLGIEGSRDVMEFWKSEIIKIVQSKLVIADIIDFVDTDGQYDMAVCMEVAEHLPEEKADDLVKKVVLSAKNYIWWTAAQPGQDGDGHINCQPICYWKDKFEHNSYFKVNWEKTYKIKQIMLQNHAICLGYPWFRDNLLLLESYCD